MPQCRPPFQLAFTRASSRPSQAILHSTAAASSPTWVWLSGCGGNGGWWRHRRHFRRGEREKERKKAKQTDAAARSTELQNWLLQEATQVKGGGLYRPPGECTYLRNVPWTPPPHPPTPLLSRGSSNRRPRRAADASERVSKRHPGGRRVGVKRRRLGEAARRRRRESVKLKCKAERSGRPPPACLPALLHVYFFLSLRADFFGICAGSLEKLARSATQSSAYICRKSTQYLGYVW